MAKVSIVSSLTSTVKEAIDLIDFKPAESYDLVAIKPNLCAPFPYYTGATTNPKVVEEIIKIFQDSVKEIVIIESNGYLATAEESFEASGLKTMCDYFGVKLVNLSNDAKVPLKREFKALQDFKCPRTFLKADAIINVPVMKTHSLTTVSLGMKNMFGIVGERKNSYHNKLSDTVCDVLSIRKPELNVMDATIGMEGEGPIHGRPKRMNLLLASTDIVALDITVCKVMKINPAQVEHIQKAAYYGLGEASEGKIEVVGEMIQNIWERFLV